jgi:pantoate--beta-alanine ligase
MEIVRSLSALRELLARWKQDNSVSIGFVPTMGALHLGHLSLVRESQSRTSKTVVSIFVNPTQFNNPADLASYPRTLEADFLALENAGVDAVYVPQSEELYPQGIRSGTYALGGLDTCMEGAARPGHFQGVATVVDALFDHVSPDAAFFGSKDFQQVAVIRRLAALRGGHPEVVACPTVREVDGLAMSSRNLLLTPSQRADAPRIFAALQKASTALRQGQLPRRVLHDFASEVHTSPELQLEYGVLADPATLEALPLDSPIPAPEAAHLFAVVRAGNVRLIDNLPVE